jgi:hypothetical protein
VRALPVLAIATPRDQWQSYFAAVLLRDNAWSNVQDDCSNTEYNRRRRAATQEALSPRQIQEILEEEQRAWNLGREWLVDLGFEDFAYYAEHERRGLHFHRYRLGIEDLWDDELKSEHAG